VPKRNPFKTEYALLAAELYRTAVI